MDFLKIRKPFICAYVEGVSLNSLYRVLPFNVYDSKKGRILSRNQWLVWNGRIWVKFLFFVSSESSLLVWQMPVIVTVIGDILEGKDLNL